MSKDSLNNVVAFINYAGEDRNDHILPLIDRLRKQNYSLWFDRENIEGGEEWKKEIDEGLRTCTVLIAVLTQNSIDPQRRWIRYEQNEALRLFIPVIPVKMTIWSNSKLPKHLKPIQFIDMSEDYELGFQSLIEAIEHKTRRSNKRLVNQTPPIIRRFVGRELELKQLYKLIDSNEPKISTGKPTIAVCGMGGIGKTTIVDELTRRLAPRYPGGMIYERRGQSPMPAQAVLRRWVSYATGEEPDRDFDPVEVRNILAEAGELLTIIDDIWLDDFANTRILLEALPQDTTRIITTRFMDGALAIGARIFELNPMKEVDGVKFLRDRLAGRGKPPPTRLLRRLWKILGGHPLAMELAVTRCHNTSHLEVQIANLEKRINEADLSEVMLAIPGLGKDVSLLVSLDESFKAICQASRDMESLFPALGVFAPDASFSATAAAAVWNIDTDTAISQLETLAEYALLRIEGERYQQHSLLHTYALSLLKEKPEEKLSAENHHAAYYQKIPANYSSKQWITVEAERQNIAYAANRICRKLDESLIRTLSQPEVDSKPEVAFDKASAEDILSIAKSTKDYVEQRDIHEGLWWLQAGLAAARLLLKDELEGTFLHYIGLWYRNRSHLQVAIDYYQAALKVRKKVGNRVQIAWTLNCIGAAKQALGQLDPALEYYEQAVQINEELNSKDAQKGLAQNFNNIARIYRAKSELELARQYYEKSLQIRETIRDRNGIAQTLNNLGKLYREMGDLDKALEFYLKALPIREEVGNKRGIAVTLNNIASIYSAMGNAKKAVELYERALKLSREAESTQSVATRLHNLAILLRENPSLGRSHESIALMEEAIKRLENLGLEISAGGRSVQDYRTLLKKWLAEESGNT